MFVKTTYFPIRPLASKAARNDLQLLQLLHNYPDREIGAVTSRKLAGHLWYLSEDLILYCLFDPDVDFNTKRQLVKGSSEKEGEKEPLKHVQVDLATVQQKNLPDFVSKRSRNIFATLGMPDTFLAEDPETHGIAEMTLRLQRQL